MNTEQDAHVFAWCAWCEENAGEWPTDPAYYLQRAMFSEDPEEVALFWEWFEEATRG